MQTTAQIILRLLHPEPLTDEEIETHIEWAETNDGETIVNFHHPFYVGIHHDISETEIPEDAPEEMRKLVEFTDMRKKLRLKHEHLHERMTDNPNSTVFWFERPYRPMVGYILMRRGKFEDQHELAEFIMDLWTDTESPSDNFVWADILAGFPLLNEPVGDTELLDPSGTTTVYRGIAVPKGEDPNEEAGYSWTTDQPQAEWFARRFLGLEGRDVPMVLTGTVKNEHVMFCTDGRSEKEVVSGAVEVTSAKEVVLA